jgi:hypothetical protein
MTTATNTRLAEQDAPPAPAPAHTNKALDRLAQHQRDQPRISTLEAERDALLTGLNAILVANGHWPRILHRPYCGMSFLSERLYEQAAAAIEKVSHG